MGKIEGRFTADDPGAADFHGRNGKPTMLAIKMCKDNWAKREPKSNCLLGPLAVRNVMEGG